MLRHDAAEHAKPQQPSTHPDPVEFLHDSHAETQQPPGRFEPVEVLQGDPAVARTAAVQAGVVTRDDLSDAGLSRGAIAHRIARERLHRQHRGTYLLGHEVPPKFAPYVAAAFALGDNAYVDHRSALVLYEVLDPIAGEDIHVMVIGKCRRSRTGIKVHRTTRIGDTDYGLLDGVVPIVSPARAILAYADDARPADLARAVNQAQVKGLVKPDDLYEIMERTPGRKGIRVLKAVLDRHDGPKKFNSGGERIVLAKLKRARLPKPEVNAKAEGKEVDYLYREEKVVIEFDGGAAHGTPAAVTNDRRKDAYMRSKGYIVLRYSWWQFEEELEAVIAEISATLADRRR
jgi:very-short-patch-repair endonuclease